MFYIFKVFNINLSPIPNELLYIKNTIYNMIINKNNFYKYNK